MKMMTNELSKKLDVLAKDLKKDYDANVSFRHSFNVFDMTLDLIAEVYVYGKTAFDTYHVTIEDYWSDEVTLDVARIVWRILVNNALDNWKNVYAQEMIINADV